jgi:hypothetical protein
MPKPAPPSLPKSPPKKRAEIDVSTLKLEDAKKRCASIYKLEKAVEAKAAAHTIAKSKSKATAAALDRAEEDLRKEITEQRFGPGPLYSADGKGAAK